ncbi:MAG: hypothetical protein V2I47_10525 [Bacteroidales bacterium]|jgi:hypothetical protein|nr:hypothetical protein [Bacteroidales bacterium]
MNKIKHPLGTMLLAFAIILSCCKKDDENQVIVPVPDTDPTLEFIADSAYISGDVILPLNAIFRVGVQATNGGGKNKLLSFMIIRTFEGLNDTLINHSISSQDYVWEGSFDARDSEGNELWSFIVTDDNGQTASVALTITTMDPGPSISFIHDNLHVSGDTTLEKNAVFSVGINASSSPIGAALGSFRVERNFNGSPQLVFEKILSGQEFAWDSAFNASNVAGEEYWTFTITDQEGDIAMLSFVITTENEEGEIIAYADINMGSYNEPFYGAFLDAVTGLVYNRNEASMNQELIDIVFYRGALNGPTFGAPSNEDVQAVYDLMGIWVTFNTTLFQTASITAGEFDAIGSVYTFPAFTGDKDDINDLQINDVVFFKSHDNKLGYIKVNSINAKGDFINIDLKVEP